MTKKKYYSYKTFEPVELSDTYVSPHHELFTGLNSKSDEELEELGFVLTEIPEIVYKIRNWEGKYPPEEFWTKSYCWYRDDPPRYEVSENTIESIRRGISYTTFWDDFCKTTAYDKIRELSMTSLPVNTIATELIYLFYDAKTNNSRPLNVDRIQSCFDFIFANVEFTAEELQKIQEIFVGTGMHYQYTITNGN